MPNYEVTITAKLRVEGAENDSNAEAIAESRMIEGGLDVADGYEIGVEEIVD